MHSLSQQRQERRYERRRDRNREGISEQDCKWCAQLQVPRLCQDVPYFQNVLRVAVHFHKKSMMFSAPIFVELVVVSNIMSMALCTK